MQPLALEGEALASGCLKKMGQKKENYIMYLYVKWNSFKTGLSAD